MLLVKKIFKFHARVQKCHFGYFFNFAKVKSTKRGFSKKALTEIDFFFLF